MAFSVLKSITGCSKQIFDPGFVLSNQQCIQFFSKFAAPKILVNALRGASFANTRNYSASDRSPKVKRAQKQVSSESASDSDLEPLGHRGESFFWRRKIHTFHGILDVNKDGVISFDDFNLLADRFIELGHLSEKHTIEFRKLLKSLWEKRWGPISPYNLVTVEQYLEDMHHVINDKKLVRKAHAFLPYLFRAVDKDQSGQITEQEFKLFFKCLGLKEVDAALAFRCLDDNSDGKVTINEFIKHGRNFFLTEDENNVSKYFFGGLIEEH